MPLPVILRVSVLASLLPVLAGCGPERNEFAPACPSPVMPALTADVAAYRPGSTGRDLPDLVFSGRMTAIKGQCKLGDSKGKLETTVAFAVELTRGPAMPGNTVEVPVYLAVTEGDRILDKRVIMLRGAFASNVDRVTLDSGALLLILPISPTKSGAAYSVLAGFQLTPDQLAAARAKGTR